MDDRHLKGGMITFIVLFIVVLIAFIAVLAVWGKSGFQSSAVVCPAPPTPTPCPVVPPVPVPSVLYGFQEFNGFDIPGSNLGSSISTTMGNCRQLCLDTGNCMWANFTPTQPPAPPPFVAGTPVSDGIHGTCWLKNSETGTPREKILLVRNPTNNTYLSWIGADLRSETNLGTATTEQSLTACETRCNNTSVATSTYTPAPATICNFLVWTPGTSTCQLKTMEGASGLVRQTVSTIWKIPVKENLGPTSKLDGNSFIIT